MKNFFDKFRIGHEKEELSAVVNSIETGVVFRGTNLWILIFAIFVASLGLNVNSAAVIIGAMLISPLMGPIMGVGLGVGIHDLALLRKSLLNYAIATGVALTASTIFFLISPLNEAHSELLARTSPTIYDVLIAMFGGFAGIVATSSRQKGNVIPGVAIATALMPPLCTAGYGLATFQLNFFFGAFYLYIINTVFIALATFILVRILHFPVKHLKNKRADKIAQRIVWLIAILTLVPSLYFGYDMVQQERFKANANQFVTNEAHFPNDYLLSRKIDAKKKTISLVFGGKEIEKIETESLRQKLKHYGLDGVKLDIKQGFAYLNDVSESEKKQDQLQLSYALDTIQKELVEYRVKADSMDKVRILTEKVFKELSIQFPAIDSAIIQSSRFLATNGFQEKWLVLIFSKKRFSHRDQLRMQQWLEIRLEQTNIKLIFAS